MAITTIAGLVTGVRVDTQVSTTITGNTASTSTQSVRVDFRVDNHPAFMKSKVNLANGDLITAGGIQRSGEFEVFAFHNHTTKTLYWIQGYPIWLIALIFVFGFITLGVFVGIFILGYGVYMLISEMNKKRLAGEALSLVKNSPVPVVK